MTIFERYKLSTMSRGPIRALILTTFTTLLSSCSFSPATKDVQAFGKAATSAVTAIAVPDQVQGELLLQASVNVNACTYLQGRKFTLAAPLNKDDQLDIIKEQARFLKALKAYASALAQVTDPEGIANLRNAASGLSGSLSSLTAVIPGSISTSALVGPAINLVVNSVINISELQRRHEVRQIIEATDDTLVEGGRLIRQDYKKIGMHLDKVIREWEGHARCVLTHVRNRDAVGSYSLFVQFDAQLRSFRARRNTLNNSVNLIGQVVGAHGRLVSAEGNFSEALDDLNRTVADLEALQTAIENR